MAVLTVDKWMASLFYFILTQVKNHAPIVNLCFAANFFSINVLSFIAWTKEKQCHLLLSQVPRNTLC